jgi:hypothetical protein
MPFWRKGLRADSNPYQYIKQFPKGPTQMRREQSRGMKMALQDHAAERTAQRAELAINRLPAQELGRLE